jgi:transcriptional regulator with XRE-family HTH domain
LLKRRLDLGLIHNEVAAKIECDERSIENWERGKTSVKVWHYPRIIAFLGHQPLPEPSTLGALIRRERVSRGWTKSRLAAAAGIDPVTVGRLEMDRKGTARKSAVAVCQTLGISTKVNNESADQQ